MKATVNPRWLVSLSKCRHLLKLILYFLDHWGWYLCHFKQPMKCQFSHPSSSIIFNQPPAFSTWVVMAPQIRRSTFTLQKKSLHLTLRFSFPRQKRNLICWCSNGSSLLETASNVSGLYARQDKYHRVAVKRAGGAEVNDPSWLVTRVKLWWSTTKQSSPQGK